MNHSNKTKIELFEMLNVSEDVIYLNDKIMRRKSECDVWHRKTVDDD